MSYLEHCADCKRYTYCDSMPPCKEYACEHEYCEWSSWTPTCDKCKLFYPSYFTIFEANDAAFVERMRSINN